MSDRTGVPPWKPEILHLHDALRVFESYDGPTQSQGHIRPIHRYLSLRLVLEGGFLPGEITPRPPLRVECATQGRLLLDFEAAEETTNERTVLGGLKTKDIDVVVTKPQTGPVVAISVKGTTGAFRNLTNRMEEAIGDSTNLHIMYPGLVYGFFQVIRANRAGDPGISANDVAIDENGKPVESVLRYHRALAELSGRRFVRDDLTRYERVAFLLAETNPERAGEVLTTFPPPGSPIRTEGFFRFVWETYDLRFPFAGPAIRELKRVEWDPESPAILALGGAELAEQALGYAPRLAA